MAKSKGLKVTAGERVLLHLRRYNRYRNAKGIPPDVTQEGISQAAGVRITHVPRTIKKLKKEGFLEDRKDHVAGRSRRLKVYFLTDEGMAHAKTILDRLMAEEIEIRDGGRPARKSSPKPRVGGTRARSSSRSSSRASTTPNASSQLSRRTASYRRTAARSRTSLAAKR